MALIPRLVHRTRSGRPWATYALTAVCTGIFILIACFAGVALGRDTLPSADAIMHSYGFVPGRVRLLSIFTCMFLHGDFSHLFGNMYFLIMFGEELEAKLGSFLFLLSYFICGICGTLLFYAGAHSSLVPCIGASAAIGGVMGMYVVLFPKRKVEFVWLWELFVDTPDAFQISALAWVVMWVLFQTWLGVTFAGASEPVGVAFLAHTGGAVAGMILGAAFGFSGLPQLAPDTVQQERD